AGLLTPCDWLKADLRLLNGPDGKPFAVTLAWLGDEEPTTFAAPQGWQPGQIEQISPQEVKEKYDLVKTEHDARGAAVLAYRHREPGGFCTSRARLRGVWTYRSDIGPLGRTSRN